MNAGAEAPIAIAGIWTGTAHSNSLDLDYHVQGLALPDLQFRYIGSLAGTWSELAGQLNVTGSAISGSGTLTIPTFGIDPFTVTATGVSETSITGTTIDITKSTGTLALTWDTAANIPVQLANLAGSYSSPSSLSSSGLTTLAQLDQQGNLTGSDSAGSFTGTLTQVSANLNAFQVSATYTLTGGAATVYTGLAYVVPVTQSASQQFVVLTSTATQPQVFTAEFTQL